MEAKQVSSMSSSLQMLLMRVRRVQTCLNSQLVAQYQSLAREWRQCFWLEARPRRLSPFIKIVDRKILARKSAVFSVSHTLRLDMCD